MSKFLQLHSHFFLHTYYSENFQYKEGKPEIFAGLLENGNALSLLPNLPCNRINVFFVSHKVDIDKNSTQMCLLGFEGNLWKYQWHLPSRCGWIIFIKITYVQINKNHSSHKLLNLKFYYYSFPEFLYKMLLSLWEETPTLFSFRFHKSYARMVMTYITSRQLFKTRCNWTNRYKKCDF